MRFLCRQSPPECSHVGKVAPLKSLILKEVFTWTAFVQVGLVGLLDENDRIDKDGRRPGQESAE